MEMERYEQLMSDFADGYMKKIFYFCLKKTGSADSAEDLTQDISLSVLTELHRGVDPDNFAVWVWQIARNRYARWADKKHRQANAETGVDIGEYEISDGESLEDEYIVREQLPILQRELAFIGSEYRDIIVAYYIEDRSVREIAESNSIPIGTVKSKLHRARNILKEGMNMARQFGALSYKPENINFIGSGNYPSDGAPWSIVSHSLYKNMLLAAYRTPSTAEELAIELGVALPYTQDELDFLVSSTLMRKNGNKYETAFFIISAEAQRNVNEHLMKLAPELTGSVIDALEYRTKCLNRSGIKWHGETQNYEDMKWALLMMLTDSISDPLCSDANTPYTSRPNDSSWDIVGFEEYKREKPSFVGKHFGIDMRQFKFNYMGIGNQTPLQLSQNECEALLSAASEGTSGLFADVLDRLYEYGYIKRTENGYVPACAVYYGENGSFSLESKLSDEEKAKFDVLCVKATEIARLHYDFCREQIYAEIPKFLKSDRHQIDFATDTLFSLRGAVIEAAIDCGYISYGGGATEGKDRMLGAYVII